ncbi:hypothetical protein SAMN05660385_00842 [Pseudomonas sp. URIL14HWK12:I5]|nr:hypothetical protein SAMN05660385_00842 [Pseudomonas sp. URIL14HWK12:I5]
MSMKSMVRLKCALHVINRASNGLTVIAKAALYLIKYVPEWFLVSITENLKKFWNTGVCHTYCKVENFFVLCQPLEILCYSKVRSLNMRNSIAIST